MRAEERKKRDREEKERKRREEERQRKDLEIRQKQDEERRKELEKAEEERKRRELDRQEKEKRRKEWERQEQEKKRRQDEEEKRRELERLEKKKREWEKQERQKKRKEWERQEEERKKKEAEREEHEKKKMEEKRKQRELKRKEERRRLEQQKEKELCSPKGEEQATGGNRRSLQSGSSEPPPPPPPAPPRLSAISAPPSDISPPSSRASPPYPWLSRGGVLPAPAAQPANGPTPAERLRPPPLTPQTEYAREKQRQREMSSSGGTFSPLSTHNTSGTNQLMFPNKPPAMQPAPDQSKDPVKERDGSQHTLPSMALREPPKLYQAFPREALPPPPLSSSTRAVLNKQTAASTDDGAQFEEEPSELSTLLPDGLANIMAMLDESIKKEEELYNSEKSSSLTTLLDNFPPGIQPVKRYLSAPDLIPATKHQPCQEDLGCNPHASPPVLSRQGSLASPCSRTSSLTEEDDDYTKPLPNVVFNPKQCMDARIALGNTNYRHSDLAKLYGLPEPTKSEADEEYDDDSETPSCSPPPQRPHLHQTGVNSTFKSLATVHETQKYTYRGGPFGRPPPSALVGVKYSSSLSLGPDICRQQQGSSPTSDSTNPLGSSVPPFKSSHYLLEDKKLKLEDDESADWKDEETEDTFNAHKTESSPSVNPVKVIKEEQLLMTISESSLAELSQSCEVMLSRQSLPSKNSPVKSEGHDHPDDGRKPNKVKEHREKEREKEKKKHGHGGSSKKHEERKEKKHKEKRETASSSSSSSSHSSSNHKRHKDGKSHKEKDRRILGDLNLQSKERAEKNRSHHGSDKKKRRMASTSTGEEKSDSGSSLGPTDFLKLKALSDGPPKELKIRLIKVESGDRETFIASEVEEKRIPLEEIGIKNTASEIIRSCK